MTPRPPKEEANDRILSIEDVVPERVLRPKFPRGLGYAPDEADPRDYRARAMFGARAGIPLEQLDLEGCVPAIFDQQQSSSCVGQATGGAIDTRLRRLGKWDAPLTSKLGLYGYRILSNDSKDEALTDSGCNPRAVMKGALEYGVPTERRWPFDMARVNEKLPWDVMQEASACVLSSFWRIDSFGKERVEDFCQALAKGYPVTFGLPIDEAFSDVGKGAIVGAVDESRIVGGHMMYAVGYRTRPDGKRQVRCVNSWGTSWGDSGFFWAEEEFFAGVQDAYVIVVG